VTSDIKLFSMCILNLTYQIGFTVRAKAANQVARTNKAFTEGVHYWEIICPISLSTLRK